MGALSFIPTTNFKEYFIVTNKNGLHTIFDEFAHGISINVEL
jgi:hypothetical protein